MENYSLPFEINTDDYRNIKTGLKVGDTITAWYDHYNFNENATISHDLEYIDKGKRQVLKVPDDSILLAEIIVAIFFGIMLLAGY